MPFARFQNLAVDKRELVLDTAAREFAKYGFEQASINRILDQAHMSKGAAYYYFEDKADLFYAVVQYVWDCLGLASLDVDRESLTVDNFWPSAAELHRIPLLRSFERPWQFRVISVAAQVSPTIGREPLASMAELMRGNVMNLIKRGQELGAVRTDLADELLFAWVLALDHASDTWLTSHWEDLDRQAVALISDRTVAAMRSALAPGVQHADLAVRHADLAQ